MISEWELWACANEVLRQHGVAAAEFTAERCAALDAARDRGGRETWLAIERRLAQLQQVRSSETILQ